MQLSESMCITCHQALGYPQLLSFKLNVRCYVGRQFIIHSKLTINMEMKLFYKSCVLISNFPSLNIISNSIIFRDFDTAYLRFVCLFVNNWSDILISRPALNEVAMPIANAKSEFYCSGINSWQFLTRLVQNLTLTTTVS